LGGGGGGGEALGVVVGRFSFFFLQFGAKAEMTLALTVKIG